MARRKARKNGRARRKNTNKGTGRQTGRVRSAVSRRKKTGRSAPARKGKATRKKLAKAPVAAAVLAAPTEPAIDRDPAKLQPVFRQKLDNALSALRTSGSPFKLVEGYRTVERQQWLYGAGRTGVPYARPKERIVTHADGIKSRSKHQGEGSPGTGSAADCYPLKGGKIYTPDASDPVWRRYADAVKGQGLQAGLDWPNLKDAPHCETP